MGEQYCARIVSLAVAQVIVCASAEWADSHLGAEWMLTGSRLVGIGWPVIDGEIVEPVIDAEPPPLT